MIDEDDEEQQFDVYYRGTKEQLYAFLYPLTGPNNPIFEHLSLKKTLFDPNKKQFEVQYEPKDFENIDKQKEDIIYTSTTVPTQSNYFYSLFQPQHNCFVWQSVDNFVQMRPKNRAMLGSKQKEVTGDGGKIELQILPYESPANKTRDLVEDTIVEPMKENWEVSKEEYLLHLAK